MLVRAGYGRSGGGGLASAGPLVSGLILIVQGWVLTVRGWVLTVRVGFLLPWLILVKFGFFDSDFKLHARVDNSLTAQIPTFTNATGSQKLLNVMPQRMLKNQRKCAGSDVLLWFFILSGVARPCAGFKNLQGV